MRSDDAKNYLMMQRTTALSQGKHSVKFDQPTPSCLVKMLIQWFTIGHSETHNITYLFLAVTAAFIMQNI